ARPRRPAPRRARAVRRGRGPAQAGRDARRGARAADRVLGGRVRAAPRPATAHPDMAPRPRAAPRPFQRPRSPIWLAARWPRRRPIRRAARWDGVFPIDLPGPEAVAELVADVSGLRGPDAGPFD